MFTGLIEEIGIIDSIINLGGGKRIKVKANNILDDIKIDDSVAINGCCQTVVKFDKNSFEVVAIEETLRKTTFQYLKVGEKVNLERAMQLGGRMGGHYVQGHVDCVGKVLSIYAEKTDHLIKIEFPNEFRKYIVNVGSITLEGVSLTVARIDKNNFTVAIIPHTFENTILSNLKIGQKVNLEFDILAKYVENILNYK